MTESKDNTPLRVAVIGTGYLGKFHAKIYSELPNVELVGVVDSDAETAQRVASTYGCAVFDDPSELIGKIDGVSIVVPTSFHHDVSVPFIEAGIHVMMEKPIASSVEESRKVVELAKQRDIILQVGHVERFNPGVMKLSEMATDPRFIEVHRLGTFTERATDVDVVIDLMIHDIDIVLSLVKSPIASISATGIPVVTQHVDIANARLQFANGAVANVTASRVSRDPFRRIRLFSDNHYLGLNPANQQLEEVYAGELLEGQNFPDIVTRQVPIEPQMPLDAELAHFVDCIRHHRQPLVDGEAGLRAVEVAIEVREAITASMAHTRSAT